MKRGFTLVETLVALCLLGVAASVMVAPLLQYSRTANGIGMVQARNGLAAREAARLMTMPWDSLDARAGCAATTRLPLPHSRCVTVTAVGTTQKRVRLIVAPLAAGVRPDTIFLDRSRPAASNPFNL
jgi:prepilin-type N-terminal cleavage/methylation domain-containing protein